MDRKKKKKPRMMPQDEEAEWSKPLDHVRDLLRETLHGQAG